MARKSFVQLAADLMTSFPDNISGAITPLVLRTYLDNFLQAIRPAYGVLQRITPAAQALTTTYTPLVFEIAAVSDVPDYTATAASGTITRLEAGSVRSVFNGGIHGPNGTVVMVALFKDGVETTWRASATCSGAGETIHIALDFLNYAGAAAAYQMRVKVLTGSANITFQDVDWAIETVPVNAY